MKIEINNGKYMKDEAAGALLTNKEDEYLAALAQKLIVRQKYEEQKEVERQEKEAEKERQRQEREAEKERKRQEREAEKERQRQEKEAEKKRKARQRALVEEAWRGL